MHDRDRAAGPSQDTDGVRWLSSAEMRTWLAFRAAMRLVDGAIDADLQEQSGLSHDAYQILAMLSGAPGQRLRMSMLAALVFVSRSRLTYQVTQLEKDGLVRREACPHDKRGAVAVLTPHGYEVLRAAAPGHVACVRRVFFDALAPEQVSVLGDALMAIVERLAGETERALLAGMLSAADGQSPQSYIEQEAG